EANPNGLSSELLAGYLEVGVNRLSIGAQTLDRRGLRTLGRQHESTDVLDSLRTAREVGFERVNLDFIFGWPGQTRESWQNDLHQLVAMGEEGPDHLSLYSLIVEPGTPYADAQARGILHMPDDDVTADLYEDAISILADAGWDHYEIANWCREPNGYSRHNAIYWQHGDYLGIGAGAFGTMNGSRIMNQLLPERYINDLALNTLPQSNTEVLDEQTARGESMMLGLRMLNDGINAESFATRHGITLDNAYGEPLARMIELGMMEPTDAGVRLTQRGMMLANSVVTEFL
ncbi:MAG: radical SAM protein, partial [Chloroflexi bacterium]|nr:radical SAM protein [Chloroflexota bacterium]